MADTIQHHKTSKEWPSSSRGKGHMMDGCYTVLKGVVDDDKRLSKNKKAGANGRRSVDG